MRPRPATALLAIALVAAACSGSESAPTTAAATSSSSTTTTTAAPTTAATSSTSTTTTVPAAETTTTTVPAAETTTTTDAPAETTTTTRGQPSTTTTQPPPGAIEALLPYAGVYRQPTAWNGFLHLRANGEVEAGYNVSNLEHTGTWSYDEGADSFTFTDFDFGTGCGGAPGIYERERAFGGGQRIILVDDPCADRVAFLVQPGSDCMCFVYHLVEFPSDD